MKQTAYAKVYQAIRKDLLDGKYQVGDKLPPEPDLCAQYHVSRTTVRKAVELLIRDGFLYVKQGLGTVVLDHKIKQNYNRLNSYTETLIERGYQPNIGKTAITQTYANEEMAEILQVEPGAPMYCLYRVMKANGRPSAIIENYIPEEYTPDLPEKMKAFVSFYKCLESVYNLYIENTHDTITVRNATFEQACALECAAGEALMYTRRVCYCQGRALCYDVVNALGQVRDPANPAKIVSTYEIEISLSGRNE